MFSIAQQGLSKIQALIALDALTDGLEVREEFIRKCRYWRYEMTPKIRSQAAKFWTVLASSETLDTYQKAAVLTWQILKEGALLIWLVLCLVLVGFDLGAEKAIATGRSARTWLDSIEKADSNQLAADTKQKLISAGKTSVSTAIAQARQQLGLPKKQSADLTQGSNVPMKSAAPLDSASSPTTETSEPSPTSTAAVSRPPPPTTPSTASSPIQQDGE